MNISNNKVFITKSSNMCDATIEKLLQFSMLLVNAIRYLTTKQNTSRDLSNENKNSK